MEVSILLSLISLAGSLTVAYIAYLNNKKLNDSESKVNIAQDKKIQIETDRLLFEYKNTVIRDLQDQLTTIKREVEVLKTHEITHLEEKIRLEARIEHLTEENKHLATRIIENRTSYEDDLRGLRDKLKEMEVEIIEYKRKIR